MKNMRHFYYNFQCSNLCLTKNLCNAVEFDRESKICKLGKFEGETNSTSVHIPKFLDHGLTYLFIKQGKKIFFLLGGHKFVFGLPCSPISPNVRPIAYCSRPIEPNILLAFEPNYRIICANKFTTCSYYLKIMHHLHLVFYTFLKH